VTGYTVHTGSTVKFSSGWDHIFGGNKAAQQKPAAKKIAKKGASKSATSAGKKGAKKARRAK
jgi:hypothetical protein